MAPGPACPDCEELWKGRPDALCTWRPPECPGQDGPTHELTYQFQPVTSLGPSLSAAIKQKQSRSGEATPQGTWRRPAFSPFPTLPDPPLVSPQLVHPDSGRGSEPVPTAQAGMPFRGREAVPTLTSRAPGAGDGHVPKSGWCCLRSVGDVFISSDGGLPAPPGKRAVTTCAGPGDTSCVTGSHSQLSPPC